MKQRKQIGMGHSRKGTEVDVCTPFIDRLPDEVTARVGSRARMMAGIILRREIHQSRSTSMNIILAMKEESIVQDAVGWWCRDLMLILPSDQRRLC